MDSSLIKPDTGRSDLDGVLKPSPSEEMAHPEQRGAKMFAELHACMHRIEALLEAQFEHSLHIFELLGLNEAIRQAHDAHSRVAKRQAADAALKKHQAQQESDDQFIAKLKAASEKGKVKHPVPDYDKSVFPGRHNPNLGR